MNSFFLRNSRLFAAAALVIGLAASGTVVSAQVREVSPEAKEDPAQARRVREGLIKVLKQYPPAVGAVLKLDPSLLSSEPYIAAYPALVAYLNQHPEIRRSPSYYFQPIESQGDDSYYRDPGAQAWREFTEMITIVMVTVTMVGGFLWLIRTAIDYRRWGRLARVQAEAHTKLLDRFTGNEELLAYVQSPAGARFLQSSPISIDGTAKPMGAPITRIMWSIQAGVVLAAAGIGMNYASRYLTLERSEPFLMLSIVLLAVGLGFVVSAGLSFVLSRRLGLLADPRHDAAE